MAFLTEEQLKEMSFKHLGKHVKISDKASIYDAEKISIGDYSRIDDFCVVSGEVTIGKHVHFAVFNNVAGGSEGIVFEDYTGLAYGCHVFSQSDDYSGRTMTNPTIPNQYKNVKKARIIIKKHAILGANSLVFPGVIIEEGCSFGAMSLITKSTNPWTIYAGAPAKPIKERSKDLLTLQQKFEEK